MDILRTYCVVQFNFTHTPEGHLTATGVIVSPMSINHIIPIYARVDNASSHRFINLSFLSYTQSLVYSTLYTLHTDLSLLGFIVVYIRPVLVLHVSTKAITWFCYNPQETNDATHAEENIVKQNYGHILLVLLHLLQYIPRTRFYIPRTRFTICFTLLWFGVGLFYSYYLRSYKWHRDNYGVALKEQFNRNWKY